MKHAKKDSFDVIVIGGGHAGIEAAYAASQMGSKTALITLDLEKIGLMPCNPSIGGIGKGHIVYEISALGGLMPQLCTHTYLQARMLNTRKGAAVQGLRLQIDKHAYNLLSKDRLTKTKNLTLITGAVDEVLQETNGTAIGVCLHNQSIYYARTIILTTGTFLKGRIHVGDKNYSAGRVGEKSVSKLSQFLRKANLSMGRFKTGTPPRLLRSSIDFSKLEYQEPSNLDYLFEFYPHPVVNSKACYITHTNKKTHTIIRNNLNKSALHSGTISGTGPRYCPSIEDKITRFPDKESHHIFVEPEGADSKEIYPSGLSTSLPLEIQKEYIQSIVGFEKAYITQPGYAIEYDFVYPHQLNNTLEVKTIPGLYLAGQINGTTGYEEAAGQGIIAGINAHLKSHNHDPFVLGRHESYIGIMIDDLVTKSVDEPYRMFTSRAEYRLLLRQDNVFMRLTQKGHELGLIDNQTYQDFVQEKIITTNVLTHLRTKHTMAELSSMFDKETTKKQLRTYIHTNITREFISSRALLYVQSEIRYAPYIQREQQGIKRMRQYQTLRFPANINYEIVRGLSKEVVEKLNRYQPQTVAHATRISGMTVAAISILIHYIRKSKEHKKYLTIP